MEYANGFGDHGKYEHAFEDKGEKHIKNNYTPCKELRFCKIESMYYTSINLNMRMVSVIMENMNMYLNTREYS